MLMDSRLVLAVVVLAFSAGLGAFLLISGTSPPQQTSTDVAQRTTATAGPRVVELTLYLNDYGYNASRGGPTIRAFVGDTIRLRLVGNGSGPVVHDFVLDDKSPSPYSVKSERLRRGQVQVIEFTASFPGSFKYYCSVAPFAGPSHRDRGQEGVIEILQK